MSDEPFVVETFEHRLILTRWTVLASRERAEAFRAAILTGIAGCSPSAVICADWRRGRVVSPEVADVLTSMLTRANPRLERSAILIDPRGATFGLQAERLIREAAHPARRAMQDASEMERWLGELLTPSQMARARLFLAA